MSRCFLALSLLAAEQPATETPAAPPAVEDVLPAGAPKDDYLFVGWCYGTLRAYLDLHDRVMPEVTRIEVATYRPPGRRSCPTTLRSTPTSTRTAGGNWPSTRRR